MLLITIFLKFWICSQITWRQWTVWAELIYNGINCWLRWATIDWVSSFCVLCIVCQGFWHLMLGWFFRETWLIPLICLFLSGSALSSVNHLIDSYAWTRDYNLLRVFKYALSSIDVILNSHFQFIIYSYFWRLVLFLCIHTQSLY